ncbi:MAG: hypothetical protein AABX77_02025 [Nanoarchaeota archaeon]
MIGKCPNCGIKLKEAPFGNRETNEVVLTLKYRELIDNHIKINSTEKGGCCEICGAEFELIKMHR